MDSHTSPWLALLPMSPALSCLWLGKGVRCTALSPVSRMCPSECPLPCALRTLSTLSWINACTAPQSAGQHMNAVLFARNYLQDMLLVTVCRPATATSERIMSSGGQDQDPFSCLLTGY